MLCVMYDYAGWRGNQLRCWHRVLLCASSPLICPSQKFDHTAGGFSFPWNSRTNTCGSHSRGPHNLPPVLEGRATATIQNRFSSQLGNTSTWWVRPVILACLKNKHGVHTNMKRNFPGSGSLSLCRRGRPRAPLFATSVASPSGYGPVRGSAGAVTADRSGPVASAAGPRSWGASARQDRRNVVLRRRRGGR